MSQDNDDDDERAERDRFRRQLPIMLELARTGENELRRQLLEVINDAESKQDTETLALLAGWFALKSSTYVLFNFLLWIRTDRRFRNFISDDDPPKSSNGNGARKTDGMEDI
jgi:hypothetical protein